MQRIELLMRVTCGVTFFNYLHFEDGVAGFTLCWVEYAYIRYVVLNRKMLYDMLLTLYVFKISVPSKS